MKKIVYHAFTLAAAIMFQEVWKAYLFATCVSAQCNNPKPAVHTLLDCFDCFFCYAMPFAHSGMVTRSNQDNNVMPMLFRGK